MTQALATHDKYATDFEALERSRNDEPDWLKRLRREAFDRFAQLGFPTARKGNEPWKYTNVAPIAEAAFRLAGDGREPAQTAVRRLVPWDKRWTNVVFVNGRYSPALSAESTDEIRVSSLAQAVRSDGAIVEEHLGRRADFQDEAFTALNTAFFDDGALVHVPEGRVQRTPLHLVYATTLDSEPTVSYPRTLIVAAPNSELTVIESYAGPASGRYFTDAVTEIVLQGGATVKHHRVPMESYDAFHVGVSRIYQDRDSSFSSLSFAKGSAIERNDIRVLLDGPGGYCSLNGLYVTTDSQHIDNYLNIDHAQPHCTSRLYYKGILDGKSKAVFGGMVLVRPGAVKTDAHQEDKNLLLSEEAEVDSKPALEIYADDVKCGHGATAGTVAEDAIFYMMSRGMDLETATAFLIKGFASEIIDTIEIAPLRNFVEKRVAETLRGVKFGVH